MWTLQHQNFHLLFTKLSTLMTNVFIEISIRKIHGQKKLFRRSFLKHLFSFSWQIIFLGSKPWFRIYSYIGSTTVTEFSQYYALKQTSSYLFPCQILCTETQIALELHVKGAIHLLLSLLSNIQFWGRFCLPPRVGCIVYSVPSDIILLPYLRNCALISGHFLLLNSWPLWLFQSLTNVSFF